MTEHEYDGCSACEKKHDHMACAECLSLRMVLVTKRMTTMNHDHEKELRDAKVEGARQMFIALITTDAGGFIPASAGIKNAKGMAEDWISVGFVYDCWERVSAELGKE
jgi:hypothetical protein